MQNFNVTGMSCAACSARVEKAVRGVKGVTECSVSLLTNSMGVQGTALPQDVIAAVSNAGYGAELISSDKSSTANSLKTKRAGAESQGILIDKETPKLVKRLCWSVLFVLILMYFSMGHMMLGFPLPYFFSRNPVAIGLVQLILAVIVMVINQKFFISGFKGMINRAPNMDSLVALGSFTSFAWSTYVLFLMSDAQLNQNAELLKKLLHSLYFESAAMILALITVGKTLEAYSKGKTTDALKGLIKLSPKTAVVLKNGIEKEINVEDISLNDIFIVKPGNQIPVDGIVIEGQSSVNEAALTGESIPCDKASGSKVWAGTINTSGFIKCKATGIGSDTVLSKIIQMVSDASRTKAPIAKIADKVSGIFVPSVITIAIIAFIVWLLCGKDFSFALERGISVLVISCPCALGLATPVAIMVGNGVGAKNGILFKTAESLEQTGKAQYIVFDKTGTVTKGKPEVKETVEYTNDLLSIALNLENKSEHPLAKAVCEYAKSKGLSAAELYGFESVPGKGIKAYDSESKCREYFGGSLSFISENCSIKENDILNIKNIIFEKSHKGYSSIVFAVKENDGRAFVSGIIFIADAIKEDSYSAVKMLKDSGIKVYMLTGDNENTAKAIAEQAGIDNVIAGVLPDKKAEKIKELETKGKVIMVGDGINDAPALTQADIGIAIGNGTDIAIDAADVVLVNGSLTDCVTAVKLSRKTLKNIKENLFWAFIYNIIGIPLACGAFIPLFGWELKPVFGAAAMSLSSFCVVTNALRLNFFKPLKHKIADSGVIEVKNKELNIENKSTNKELYMDKIIKVEGMMCSHCEAHVKEALEAIDGVTSATADHEKAQVSLVLSKPVSDETLKAAVDKAGYKML